MAHKKADKIKKNNRLLASELNAESERNRKVAAEREAKVQEEEEREAKLQEEEERGAKVQEEEERESDKRCPIIGCDKTMNV